MRKPKETHLWFIKGDDEIQVESHCKELNKAIPSQTPQSPKRTKTLRQGTTPSR